MFGVYFGELIIQALPAAVLAYGFALLIYRLKDGQIPDIPKVSHTIGCAVVLVGGALFRIVAMNTFVGSDALFAKTNEAMAFYLVIAPACVAIIFLHFAKKSSTKLVEAVPSTIDTSDDEVFLQVARELAANQKDEALWMKAFALENGDAVKTKAHYVRLRVEKLQGAAQRPHASQLQQPSTTVSKSFLALPNLLVVALYVVSVFAMSSKYGFSMTTFARSLGACAIPALLAFAWTMRRDDAQRLKTASYIVTGLFFAVVIMSQLQVAKEKEAAVASPAASSGQIPSMKAEDFLDGKNLPASTPAVPSQVQEVVPSQSKEQQDLLKAAQEIIARFPQLDIESPNKDQVAIDFVVRIRDGYVARGHEIDIALRMAANDYAEELQRQAQQR